MMATNDLQKRPPRRRLGAILWPLALIALGFLLLLDNLGYLGSSAWSVMWNLWPIVFIAIGLDALFRKKEIFGPVFWVGLGGVFLLYNFGVVGWDAWSTLFLLWPLLLVTAGLEILIGKRNIWISLPASLLILGIVGVALILSGALIPTSSNVTTDINVPLNQAERAEITISMAAGDLSVSALQDPNTLIAGEVNAATGAGVRDYSEMDGNTLIYSVEHNLPVISPISRTSEWNLAITSIIPIDLETKMGAGSMNLNLAELTLEALDLGQGAGDIEVRLPEGGYIAQIGQAVGEIVIVIPREVPVRFQITRAISSVSLPPNFEKSGNYYYPQDARLAEEYLTIQISQAVGSVTVRYE